MVKNPKIFYKKMRLLALLIISVSLFFISEPRETKGKDAKYDQNSLNDNSGPSGTLNSGLPIPEDNGKDNNLFGLASYYGDEFMGKTMACGGQFSQETNNAAHPWLPCGTLVRVHNYSGERFTDVVISDRGPFVPSRIIDLSKRSFAEIAATTSGLIKVKLEILE